MSDEVTARVEALARVRDQYDHAKADLDQVDAEIAALLKCTRLTRLQDDLKAELGRLKGAEEIAYSHLEDAATAYYVDHVDEGKKVHPAVTVTAETPLIFTDVAAAVKYAATSQDLKALVVTKFGNASTAKSTFKRLIEMGSEYDFAHILERYGIRCAKDLSEYLPPVLDDDEEISI